MGCRVSSSIFTIYDPTVVSEFFNLLLNSRPLTIEEEDPSGRFKVQRLYRFLERFKRLAGCNRNVFRKASIKVIRTLKTTFTGQGNGTVVWHRSFLNGRIAEGLENRECVSVPLNRLALTPLNSRMHHLPFCGSIGRVKYGMAQKVVK